MIYVITGDINTGKSTYLLSLYHQIDTGDGFYNRKIYSGTIYIGQEIVQLSSGKTCAFSYRRNQLSDHWDELYTYQDYSFSRSGLRFCSEIIHSNLNNQLPFFIDEIGPLELQEKGLYQDFQRLLQTKKDIYVVIRNRCLSEVLFKFGIQDYKILFYY